MEPELNHESDTAGKQKVELLESFIESPSTSLALELLTGNNPFTKSDLDNSLITACHRGHKFLIQILTDLGANVNMKDSDGNTPLMISAQNGLTDVSDYLIRRGADVNEVNSVGDTALILSIRPAGSRDITNLLLEQKQINIHHQNKNGYTALMKALEIMDIDVVKLLLDKDGKILENMNASEGLETYKDKAQETADKSGIGKVFKLLLDSKQTEMNPIVAAIEDCDMETCDILIDCQFSDTGNKSQTMQTAFNKLILSHEKSKQDFNESEVRIAKRLLDHGAKIKQMSYYSEANPLIVAIDVGSYNMVKLLCEHVSDMESLFSYRQSRPLAAAAKVGRCDLINLLIKFGAKVNTHDFTNSALDCALRHGHIDCADLLIKHGAIMDIKRAFSSAVSEQLPEYLKNLVDNFKIKARMCLMREDFSDLLVKASSLGNLEIINLLLEAGADINCANHGKKTPLMESRNAEVVRFLIKRGAVVNKRRRHQWSYSSPLTYILAKPLYDSDNTREAGIIQALLENGAAVNGTSNNGNTPLMLAFTHRRSGEIVQMLLNHGADVNVKDDKGNTVLIIAARQNLAGSVNCLLQFIKGRNDFINMKNYEGETALMVASTNCNSQILKDLLDNGADVNVTDNTGNTVLINAVQRYSTEAVTTLLQFTRGRTDFINMKNYLGVTALMAASTYCKPQILKDLLDNGADVNVTDNKGNTVLINVARQDCAEAVMSLLEFTRGRSDFINIKNYLGETALMAASTYCNPQILKDLLDNGADVNVTDDKGNTVLINAAQRNSTEAVTTLLQFTRGRNDFINMKNCEGVTALMAASKKCNLQILQKLIDNGANVNITDNEGTNALLHAMGEHYLENEQIVKTLIHLGSEVNCQNSQGLSPLMLAAQTSNKEILSLLLDSGAEVNSVSRINKNKTALSVLLEHNQFNPKTRECMEILLHHGASSSCVRQAFLHKLIIEDERSFISKLIQRGLGPADASFSELPTRVKNVVMNLNLPLVSPFSVSIVTGNFALSLYFLESIFLTKRDLTLLPHDQTVRDFLQQQKYQGCVDVLNEMSAQPMSLFKLGFMAVLSALGSGPGRENRINVLPVPQVIKDRLMFQKEDVILDLTTSKPKPLPNIPARTLPNIHAFQLGYLARVLSASHFLFDD